MKRKTLVLLLLVYPFCLGFTQNQLGNYISINSFGHAAFEPFQFIKESGEDPRFVSGAGSWSDDTQVGIGFTLQTPDERLGAKLEFVYKGGDNFAPLVGDNAELWVRPFDWLRLDVGKFHIDTLRGRVSGSDFAQYLAPSRDEDIEDMIFQGFSGGNLMFVDGAVAVTAATGVLLSVTPVEGLFIGAMVNPPIGGGYDNWRDQNASEYDTSAPPREAFPQDLKDVWFNGQYAAGYTLPDIGSVRIQYIGGTDIYRAPGRELPRAIYSAMANEQFLAVANYAQLNNPRSFQGAFSFRGVENLLAEIGVTFPLPVSDDGGSLQRPVKIAAAGEYTLENWFFKGNIYSSFLGKEESNEDADPLCTGFTLGGGFTPAYRLGSLTVGMDFLVDFKAMDKWERYDDMLAALPNPLPPRMPVLPPLESTRLFYWGIGAWAEKTFSHGSIKTGLAFAGPFEKSKAPMIITIPVLFSYDI